MTATIEIQATQRLIKRKRVVRDAGVRTHPARKGPESELVREFLRDLTIVVPSDCECTLFREPRLECGVPDLVIAVWHRATVERWVAARDQVVTADLRMLQFLVNAPGVSLPQLVKIYGEEARASLERLRSARLVIESHRTYSVAALSRALGLRAVLSVEAKMSDWKGAVDQARRNLWFACASYVLLPGAPPRSKAAFPGIRFCSPDRPVIRAPQRRLPPTPRSYAVWLINEWVWRTRHALPSARGV